MTEQFAVPDSIEPVYGFRTWLATEDLELTPVVKQVHVWNGQPAVCIRHASGHVITPAHEAPGEDCQCGYWILDTYQWLQTHGTCPIGHIRSVRGICAGWGKTIVCQHGWRVQHAVPLALMAWPERRELVKQPFNPDEHQDEADRWNAIIEQLAEKHGLPILADGDELTEHVEQLRAGQAVPT